jgi:hypothetical protein
MLALNAASRTLCSVLPSSETSNAQRDPAHSCQVIIHSGKAIGECIFDLTLHNSSLETSPATRHVVGIAIK